MIVNFLVLLTALICGLRKQDTTILVDETILGETNVLITRQLAFRSTADDDDDSDTETATSLTAVKDTYKCAFLVPICDRNSAEHFCSCSYFYTA